MDSASKLAQTGLPRRLPEFRQWLVFGVDEWSQSRFGTGEQPHLNAAF